MSEQTPPPAVSEAMRDAVARWLKAANPSWFDTTCADLASDFCASAGPIASEIARLTGERDAAVANAREPVGDVWDLVRHMEEQCRAFIREKDEWRTAALAAEAETARLRAALEDAADSFDNIANHADPFDDAVGTRDNRLLHDVEKMAGAAGDVARAALTSQEKTDA